MPRKEFLRDLAEAAVPGHFSYIAEISAGECDGSISFTFAAPETSLRLDFQAIVSDSHDYPKDHSFLVFSSSENCPITVTSSLEKQVPQFIGSTIHDVLIKIEDIITNCIIYPDSASTDPEQADTPDFDDAGSAGHDSESVPNISEPGWESDDEDITFLRTPSETKLREMIRQDFRAVKDAGFKVGYLGSKFETIIVSVACRIAKLGISEETMNAWGVEPSEYLVLLIRYHPTYLDLRTILETASDVKDELIRMHVGLCTSYKPHLDHALEAIQGSQNRQPASDTTIHGHLLKPLFIGRSLNLLLEERLLGIIKLRVKHGFSWTGAELFFQTNQCKIYSDSDTLSEEYHQSDSWATSTPAILVTDHLAEVERNTSKISLPLLAMQFTLRHFVKCTEFCLVCHCKTGDTFEALKPYVCSSGLCLYQFMELGMGPSLEYEIRSQPFVVDLLVSLAYARSMRGLLEDFPTGLRLRVPGQMFPENVRASTPRHIANLYIHPDRIDLRPKVITPIKVGDWIVIMEGGQVPGVNEWHCRVKSIDKALNNILISPPMCQGQQLRPEELPSEVKLVNFVIYDTNLDDLTPQMKQKMICCLFNVLPSVEDMKTFIGSYGRGKPLSSWEDVMSPAGIDLLRWIIASNRSFIVQDDNEPRYQVGGMKGYIQFRFAQGAADKEERFIDAVNSVSASENPENPTFFAWHGSPLHNWHSILREGLHFKRISHGRSCGDGVYLSNFFHTSLVYTANQMSLNWPSNRRLKLASVISLNEVVNAPEKFVSCSPHYVVQHLDWIQPRYLFVQLQGSYVPVNPRVSAANWSIAGPPRPQPSPYGYDGIRFYKQDKRHIAIGPDGKPIRIPLSIISGQQGRALRIAAEIGRTSLVASSMSYTKRRKYSAEATEEHEDDDNLSVETTAEDLDALLSDDETSDDCIQEEPVPAFNSQSNFQPGTLEGDSLPTLAAPQYATTSATKILQHQLNTTIKTQQKVPLHELGWYVDLNLITTVYQWIVELHSFDPALPLAKDLKAANLKSIVLELRFPPQFPMDPPFVRVVRPRFLQFAAGGGGHITTGGSMCMELLTHSGWLPTASIESVLLQVRMAIINTEPRPARLNLRSARMDYSVGEAVEAYKRVSIAHGWEISKDIQQLAW
ncbi:Ubiquitin-conjugating enzyme E2 [Penicillium paradoxum]|uniref:Ubiquitin-conjugating enzyme E2 n=1 Tax=Penicillium paradoxum TaxID=176176 RepID=UPI002547FD9D|nr:Ubiquitin-conjugating enzyme E2 [Penicillium paradoxum]KAJ5780960.1 Ubiquitin-conjugating enzyme E2 [Penicillium paradoxum]